MQPELVSSLRIPYLIKRIMEEIAESLANDKTMYQITIWGDDSPTEIVTNAFITETTDRTPIVVLRNDNRVLANYQVLVNDELFKLDKQTNETN